MTGFSIVPAFLLVGPLAVFDGVEPPRPTERAARGWWPGRRTEGP